MANHLRVAQINAENLFLFFDQALPANWKSLPEKEWQRLSHASVQNKSLKKTLWIAQSLKHIDADIVMVNEVGGEESLVNFAREFLDDKYKAYVIEGNSDRGIDVGYLIKKTHTITAELHTNKNRPIHFLYPHEITNNKHFEKTAPEKVIKSHYFSRDCAELRILGPNGKPTLVLLLVHLKSKLDPDGIDPEGRERRAAELKTVVEIYRDLRREFGEDLPIIIGGDFNGIVDRVKGEKEFQPLFDQTDLENVFSILGRTEAQAMTQIQFNRSGQSTLLQIDYIFVSRNLQSLLVPEETFVYRYQSDLGVELALPQTYEQRLMLPSDHYPVVATFRNNFF